MPQASPNKNIRTDNPLLKSKKNSGAHGITKLLKLFNLLMITFENGKNYSILFEISIRSENVIRTALTAECRQANQLTNQTYGCGCVIASFITRIPLTKLQQINWQNNNGDHRITDVLTTMNRLHTGWAKSSLFVIAIAYLCLLPANCHNFWRIYSGYIQS